MLVKFNPTGTHIQKGFLKVRLDLYPDVGDKTYSIHHIQVPVIPEGGYPGEMITIPVEDAYLDGETTIPVDQTDYDNWFDALPRVWQLNPALSHFIKIKETSTKADLTDYLEQIFNPTIIKTLDDSLILPNSSHLVSPLMRDKAALTTEKIVTKDIEGLIASVNSRFASLVLGKVSGDDGLLLTPQSITVGSLATDRGTSFNNNYTIITKDNPANASGPIDTIAVWVYIATTGFRVASFYATNGNTFSTRDSEYIGAVAQGSEQTITGLDMDIETDDYIGYYEGSGKLEADSSGYQGVWYISGLNIPCTDQAFSWLAGYTTSVYGTGTEVGGPTQQSVGGGSIAIGGALNRNIFIGVGAGSITIVGALTSILTFFQTVGAGAVAIAGALTSVLTFFKTVGGGSVTISGALNRLIKIGVGAGSITIAGVLGLKTLISVGAGAVTSSATLGRKIAISVGSGSVAMAGSLVASLIGVIQQAVGGGAVAITGALNLKIKLSVGNGIVAIAGVLGWIRDWIQLTLKSRLFSFTLKPRTVSLTLQPRTLNLTLQPRTLSFTLQPRSLNLTLKAR